MDAQSLFSGKGKKKKNIRSKIVAVGRDIDDRPLSFGLEQDVKSELKYGTSAERFEWITQGSVDLAFISSIDFSRLKGGWKVLPDICKSTKGPAKRMALFFNKNLSDIESIAIPSNTRTSEIVLKIILKELHQIETRFVKSSGSLADSLKKCDAALLTGDQAIYETMDNPFFIDLGEEWYDLTGLPLVHGFWVGNELTTSKDDFKKLMHSWNQGIHNIPLIAGEEDKNTDYIINYLKSTVKYKLGEEEQAGLNELYRFAFFYGFVDYIPDFDFVEI